MPRTAKRSDDAYNARRRFTRAAKRYMDKSRETVGSERAKYREMARDYTLKAAELYERKADIERSKDFRTLANEFNLSVSEFVTGKEPTERERERRHTLVEQSKQVRAMVETERGTFRQPTEKERRDQEARAILNSPIGSRIYAGLVSVWAQPTFEDGQLVNRKRQEDINRLIMEHYGVESMMDVIEQLQAANPDLFADPKSLERYNEIRLSIELALYE